MLQWMIYMVPIAEGGELAWPSRFTFTEKEAIAFNSKVDKDHSIVSLESIKRDVGLHMFNQEYLLEPVYLGDKIILSEWIRYYNDIGDFDVRKNDLIMAVDPAVSEKEKADYTAITVFLYNKQSKNAYCVDYINRRLSFENIKKTINKLYRYWQPRYVLVEDVAAQNWLIQELKRKYGIPVKSKKRRADKRSRLVSISPTIERGQVFFKHSQSDKINQLVNFGIAEHDDLCDTVIDNLEFLYYHSGSKFLNKKNPF